jgi:hypothetical protein
MFRRMRRQRGLRRRVVCGQHEDVLLEVDHRSCAVQREYYRWVFLSLGPSNEITEAYEALT